MKKIYLALLAVAVLAGCARISDTTTIIGSYASPYETPQAIYISLPEMEIEQLVNIENGTFTVEVPTDVTTTGTIESNLCSVDFIPDGTVLSVVFDKDNAVITSNKPKISTQAKFDKFINEANSIIYDAPEMSDDEIQEKFLDYCLKAVKDNPDNAIGLFSLSNIYYMLPLDKLETALGWLTPEIKEKDDIKNIQKSFNSQQVTGEGKMFTDFTIVQNPDSPETSTIKLSDFVGKGKYILVDFWASWCGPCIREIPNIKAVYEKYAGDKFDVLSIAVWDEVLDTIMKASEIGIPWHQIINAGSIPTDIYGIDGIPHIILFGPDGTILKRNLRGEDIEAEIAKYVSPN